MNALDTFYLISAVASLILSILAIWLSLYFYDKSKNSEKSIESSLIGIKTQTQSLETLSSRLMDRLTKYVTSPKAADETTLMFFELIKGYSYQAISTDIKVPSKEGTKDDQITSYIAIYYYCSISNVSLQAHLPSLEDIESNDSVKNLLDISYKDFNNLDATLSSIPESQLKKNVLYNLYEETITNWKPYINDSASVFKARQGW